MDGKKIGARLKQLRSMSNLSQEKLAKKLGISFTAYTKYERGLRVPRDEVKIKIANYYNMSVGKIFFDE